MAVLLVFVVTSAAVLGFSVLFRKYIEPLGKKGELYVEKLVNKKCA